jgi:NosR/NirI family transcriptional regulator, nitrous oxide reductase regulator
MGKHSTLMLLLLSLWCCALSAHAEVGSVQQTWIQELFPKATRFEDKQTDFPVYPVYQLNELLGYAYESSDISDLAGFSGKPINLLIGIDREGRFTGVKVLDHHEPVFLHGLGPEPMLAFIDQYTGRSLTEHIVIDSSKVGEPSANGVVYFDGVSKATVSVIIINDTILSSALQVARHKLEGFAQAPSARAIDNLYEPLDWQQLLDKGYVGHIRIEQSDAVKLLGTSLDNYPSLPEAEDGEAFTELWYAYINAPSIGRNLLGDADFTRLMNSLKPGEQVMAIMSRGMFPHVPDDFRPGTVPGRLSMLQGGLAVELRDLNLLNGDYQLQAAGIPSFSQAQLFRVGGQAGFNPGAAASLVVSAELARNHLINDQAVFEVPVNFPQNLFEIVEVDNRMPEKEAIWIGLWKSRWHSIVLISLALVVLTVFFARQQHYSLKPKLVKYFRWGFLWFTLLYIGLYAQGQLSVVNIYTLFLSIYDGFDIGVFLLDPVLFILWTYTFVTLFIWGRGLFCGWLCPFGALQEMTSWLAKKLRIRQYRIPETLHRKLILIKYPILVILVGSAFYSLTLAEQLAEVEPFKTSITLYFWRYWPFVLYAVALLAAGLFVHKFYCRYLCPLGAGLAVLGRLRLFSWLQRIDKCGSPCQLCKRRCEINAIRNTGEIDYDECIQCLECVVILRDETQCVDTINRRKQQQRAQLLATDVSATDVGFTNNGRQG